MRDFWCLNKKIEEHVLEVEDYYHISMDEYMDFMRKIYHVSSDVLKASYHEAQYYKNYMSKQTYQKGISLDETLGIVLKFLKEIDASLVVLFKDAIKNHIISFHTPKELRKLEITSSNFYYFYSLAGIHDGKYVVNIVLENTIRDAFVIVHEFMHYVSMESINKKSFAWLYFTEGYSYAFEVLLLDFLCEQLKWADEAKRTYLKNVYDMYLRNGEFRKEFLYLDIFLKYGSFGGQKVFKYCSDEKDANRILMEARCSEEFLMRKEQMLRCYLEDSRYVLAVPFTSRILDKYPKEKDEILKEHRKLEEFSLTYFMDKYDLEHVDDYQKIFRM